MSFNSVTARNPRYLFASESCTTFAPWIDEHMHNVQAVVDHILENKQQVEENPSPHSHHCGWGYGGWGPWWGWGPSYSPVTILNGREDNKETEKDHSGLAIIFSITFFVLTFFCGKAYSDYSAYKTLLRDQQDFSAEFKAAVKKYHQLSPPKELETIKHINSQARDLLKKKYNGAVINLALLISGMATALFIAAGSYFKMVFLRYAGLIAIFPLGGYALFRWGANWNDHSECKIARTIQNSLKNYSV